MPTKEDKTIETYDNEAMAWHKLHKSPDTMQMHFIKFRKFLSAGKILDIGCGSGKDATLFLDAGYEYVGIDASDGMLQIAIQLLPQVDFRKLNMRNISKEFSPASFDGFWASASLIHISKRDISNVIGQIALVMKKGGIGMIALKEGNGEQMRSGAIIKGERFFALYQQSEFANILYDNGVGILALEADLRKCYPSNFTIWNIYYVEVL